MKGKAFAPPGSFYIVDAINCDCCGKLIVPKTYDN